MFNQRTEGYADHLCVRLGPAGIDLIWTRSEELTRCCEAVTQRLERLLHQQLGPSTGSTDQRRLHEISTPCSFS